MNSVKMIIKVIKPIHKYVQTELTIIGKPLKLIQLNSKFSFQRKKIHSWYMVVF